jgi:hypothetical protein
MFSLSLRPLLSANLLDFPKRVGAEYQHHSPVGCNAFVRSKFTDVSEEYSILIEISA